MQEKSEFLDKNSEFKVARCKLSILREFNSEMQPKKNLTILGIKSGFKDESSKFEEKKSEFKDAMMQTQNSGKKSQV